MNKQEMIDAVTLIEEKVGNLIFNIAKDVCRKELFNDGVYVVSELAHIKKLLILESDYNHFLISKEEVRSEVKNVSCQLKRWANNQSMINAKILNEYLILQRDGVIHITEGILKSSFGDDANYVKYFQKMVSTIESDGCKIFDVYNDGRRENIMIWEPVKTYVEKYKKNIGLL